eukprot:8886726-Alexandrium_andersonii.AAC.1
MVDRGQPHVRLAPLADTAPRQGALPNSQQLARPTGKRKTTPAGRRARSAPIRRNQRGRAQARCA